jgi:hypothetical protein
VLEDVAVVALRAWMVGGVDEDVLAVSAQTPALPIRRLRATISRVQTGARAVPLRRVSPRREGFAAVLAPLVRWAELRRHLAPDGAVTRGLAIRRFAASDADTGLRFPLIVLADLPAFGRAVPLRGLNGCVRPAASDAFSIGVSRWPISLFRAGRIEAVKAAVLGGAETERARPDRELRLALRA